MLNRLLSSSVFTVAYILLFPFVVGAVVNFDFIDWGVFAISVFWMFILFIPYYFYPKKWLFVTLLSVPFLISLVDLIHWFLLSGPLSVSSLFVMLETNSSEANDFIETYLSTSLVLLVLFFVCTSILLVLKMKVTKRSLISDIFMGVGTLAFLIIFIQKMTIDRMDLAYPSPVVAVMSYFDEITRFREKANARDVDVNKLKVNAEQDDKDEVHIVVIGESLNRNHLGLYGFEKNTTPLLEDIQDELFVYKDVISASTSTLASLKLALTKSNHQNGIPYYNSYSLIDLARAGGYQIYWISNQSPIGVWDNEVSVMANTSDEVYFVNKAMGSRSVNLVSYDEKSLPPLTKVLNKNVKKKLIVLHMMGSHISYRKRYPKQFEYFKVKEGDSEEKSQKKEYHNSVRYTDYILSEVINSLKTKVDRSTISSMVFISDHGENVYDDFGEIGHGSNKISRHHVEVPFIVWLSKSYRETYSSHVNFMKENTGVSYFCDDFIHSQANLMRLKSTEIEESKSVFSPLFQFKKRELFNVDYDVELKVK